MRLVKKEVLDVGDFNASLLDGVHRILGWDDGVAFQLVSATAADPSKRAPAPRHLSEHARSRWPRGRDVTPAALARRLAARGRTGTHGHAATARFAVHFGFYVSSLPACTGLVTRPAWQAHSQTDRSDTARPVRVGRWSMVRCTRGGWVRVSATNS